MKSEKSKGLFAIMLLLSIFYVVTQPIAKKYLPNIQRTEIKFTNPVRYSGLCPNTKQSNPKQATSAFYAKENTTKTKQVAYERSEPFITM